MKRGQAAMEFLMTYGWAIIAVLITIAALAYFGVLNPSIFLPESCTMFPGIACTDVTATSLEVYIVVQNGFGRTLSQFEISLPGCGIGSAANGLADGEKETIVIPSCSYVSKSRIKDTLLVTYKDGALIHNRIGTLASSVEGNINQLGSRYKSVNFRSSSGGLVTGYLDDTGAVYGVKPDGNTYGWAALNSGNMRTRATPASVEPKELLKSFAFFPNTGTATWEIEVPNGNYYVGIASGDSEFDQGPYSMTIEGIPAQGINSLSTTTNTFLIVNDIPVTVNDGRLTVAIGGGGSGSTLMNYIRIRPK